MKKDHNDWEILRRYVKGELSPKEKKDLEAHLKSDKALSEDLEIVKALISMGKTGDKEDKYSGIRALADLQFREYKMGKMRGQTPYGIRTYDSGLSPVIPNVRRVFDTETKDTRRVKFRIDDLVLLLSFQPVSSETFDIQGQILGIKENIPVTVWIISGKTEIPSECDDCYLFEFERVPALKYTLKIMHKDKIIGLADIEL